MRTKMGTIVGGGLLIAAIALLGGTPAGAQTLVRVDHVSSSNFDKTVKQAEAAIKGRAMMIVATLDHQNMLRMVGGNIKGSKTLEFGKPDMLKMVFVSDPEAGLEMPHKLYIYERADGKTVVSYYRAAPAFAPYGRDSLKMVGEMLDKTLDELAAEATR